MLIDHIGLFFFPQLLILRIIGRLSFPLFAWMIANGAYYTHNISDYAKRLLFFALISQVPFIFANKLINLPFYLNVLFTLFLGLLAIIGIQKYKDKMIRILIVGALALTSIILNTDYSIEGVLSIVVFYLFYKNFRLLVISQIVIFTIEPLILFLMQTIKVISPLPPILLLEPVGLLSLVFIYFYNRKPGIRLKNLFYIVYPAQYLVILIIKTLLMN